MEWFPIETAPKDGTAILIADFLNPEPKVRFTQIQSACWVVDQYRWPKGEWIGSLFEDFSGFIAKLDPTHWSPMPEVKTKLF